MTTTIEMETATPTMSQNETQKLIAEFQADGDVWKRNAVIEGNMGLARRIANKFKLKMDFEDAVQVAVTAMIRAIETFDEVKDFRFSTYAEKCMKVKLTRDVENNSKTVRVPCAEQNLVREFKRVANMLRSKLGREPFTDEVGEILIHHKEIGDINKRLKINAKAGKKMNPNDEEALVDRRAVLLGILGRKSSLVSQPNWTMKMAFATASQIANRTGSIHGSGTDDDQDFAPARFLSTEEATPDECMDMSEACSALQSAMAELSDRQRDVIRMRFFEEMTLEEVAAKIVNGRTGGTLTRERVRQIEEESLLILRTRLHHYGTDPRKIVESIALHAQQAC
jgi:RNA polymerase sigma-B factor